MKQLIDFLPVVAFFGVYLVADIYAATIALMVAAVLQVGFFKLRRWRIGAQMWVVFWVALGFGGLTLALRDPLFIQWKPTIVFWSMALAIVGSRFIGEGDLVQRALGKAFNLAARAWRVLCWGWAAAMALAGAANLWVAYQFDEATWVAYKFASAFALPILLTLGSVGYLAASGQLPQTGARPAGAPETGDGERSAS